MPLSRLDLAVVAAPDGRIYAIGGYYTNQNLTLNHVEAYDPATDIWNAVAPMPTSRSGPAAALGRDGLIYVFGGVDRHRTVLNIVEAYNPATGIWTPKTPMPTAREFSAAATASDGRIFVIGGATGPGAGLNVVEAYDPATDTWATVASMPTARYVLVAVALTDNRIYAVGGAQGAIGLSALEAYDPAKDAWTTLASMRTNRYAPGGAAGIDGRIYIFGGVEDGRNGGGTALDTAEVYDPASAGWSRAASIPTARWAMGAALGADGRIYAIGGFGGQGRASAEEASVLKKCRPDAGPLNTVERFTP